jgi:hypothetical protein
MADGFRLPEVDEVALDMGGGVTAELDSYQGRISAKFSPDGTADHCLWVDIERVDGEIRFRFMPDGDGYFLEASFPPRQPLDSDKPRWSLGYWDGKKFVEALKDGAKPKK